MLSTKSPRLQQTAQEVYKNRDTEVKKSTRSDKSSFIEGLAEEAEHVARQGQLATWVVYFREVLNRPEPEELASLPAVTNVQDINTRHPAESEVKKTIKTMKTEKASGIDSIHAEMLKADFETSTKVLTDLFKTIWKRGSIPSDWAKGLIVKLSMKGNLQNCDNWRGITLLSIHRKVFCRVLLGRMETATVLTKT